MSVCFGAAGGLLEVEALRSRGSRRPSWLWLWCGRAIILWVVLVVCTVRVARGAWHVCCVYDDVAGRIKWREAIWRKWRVDRARYNRVQYTSS